MTRITDADHWIAAQIEASGAIKKKPWGWSVYKAGGDADMNFDIWRRGGYWGFSFGLYDAPSTGAPDFTEAKEATLALFHAATDLPKTATMTRYKRGGYSLDRISTTLMAQALPLLLTSVRAAKDYIDQLKHWPSSYSGKP
jgi:hypothetical protein